MTLFITISHSADAFIQIDLQMRYKASKTEYILSECKVCEILCVVFLCDRRQRERWCPHHHLPRVLGLQRSARGGLPECGDLPDQYPQVHAQRVEY